MVDLRKLVGGYREAIRREREEIVLEFDGAIAEFKGALWAVNPFVRNDEFEKAAQIIDFAREYQETVNLADYLFVPLDSKSGRPAFLAAKNLLGYPPFMDKYELLKDLRFRIENTGEQKNGVKYIGGVSCGPTQRLVSFTGGFVMPVSYFLDFLELCLGGIKGKLKVYDGNGKQVNKDELDSLVDEMIGFRRPWAGRFLGSEYFSKYNKIFEEKFVLDNKGNLVHIEEEFSGDHLESRVDGINKGFDLNLQLDLPDNRFCLASTRFIARFGGAIMDCFRNSQDSSAGLGVQRAMHAPRTFVEKLGYKQ